MARTDDYDFLRKELCKSYSGADLPQYYDYCLERRKKNLKITIWERGLKANMQSNESAFESWAIVLKFYLHELIKTVTIDWEDNSDNLKNSLHYNRFVYRIGKFIQTYDWVLSAKPIPVIPSSLFCNCPNKEAASIEKHKDNSEGWLECTYVENHKAQYDIMNHQLPVGIFYDKVSKYTYYLTGNKSAIDIWAKKNDSFYIFELKKEDNKPLGIISEIMFYTNIMHDILSHRIRYQMETKTKKAIQGNWRSFGDFYKIYSNGVIKRINAVMLADNLHPLITQELLDFVNESARLKYLHIKYSMQTVEL